MGLLTAHLAKVRGAKQIISIDCVDYRLDRVKQVCQHTSSGAFLCKLPICIIHTMYLEGLHARCKPIHSVKSRAFAKSVSCRRLSCNLHCMQMVPGAQTINFAQEDLHRTLLDMTGGSGPDVGVEAVGMHYTKSVLSKVRRAPEQICMSATCSLPPNI